MRTMARSLVAISAAALLTLGVAAPAHAGGTDPSPPPTGGSSTGECVPSDAWTETIEHPAVGEPTIWVDNDDYVPESTETVFDHWQRYSWTGGPHPSDTAPAFPSSDWQANVAGDPHGVGVEGAYYRSHGNSGKGDWFYLEAVMKTVTIPAQGEPQVEVDNPDYVPAWTEEIEHEEVVCDTEPDIPTVGVWTLTGSATCDALTFSHATFVHRDDPEGRASTSPEYRVDVNGVIGDRIPYTWGETITVEAPDAQADTVWEVRIFAYTPMFQFTQQIGSHKFFSTDCAPPVIPEKPEPLTGIETRTSEPVCTEPLDGTATVVTEERTWVHHHRLVDGEWVLAPNRFETMWTVSGVETIDLEDCAPVEEPPVKPEEPEEPVTPPAPPAPPAADRLPSTGADPTPFGLAGLTLLVAGGAAIAARKIARHL